MEPIRAIKGMHDVMPDDMPRWHRVESVFRRITEAHGYAEIRTPIVEPTQLFVRSIGEATDIVEKEMYSFVDKGEDALTLRPEGTASAVRAYLEHSVHAKHPVAKWTYLGPMYRRERPAKGRYRQFYQLGAEIYGDPGPHVDAELIDMVVSFLRELGVVDIEVLVNSLGSGGTRDAFREALVAFLTPKRASLGEDSQRRLDINPLRILDSKDPRDQAAIEGAPSLLDLLDADDRAHWGELLVSLDALKTPYRIEPKLVRGLDYYSRTLFEIRGRSGELGAQNAICGGGRYDSLVESLGGPKTPAIGFAAGIERILLSMPPSEPSPLLDVFVIVASPSLRVEALELSRELRTVGLRTDADLRGTSMKSQMRRADKTGARLAVIVGESEHQRGVVQLKDMQHKTQDEVPRAELAERARSIIAR